MLSYFRFSLLKGSQSLITVFPYLCLAKRSIASRLGERRKVREKQGTLLPNRKGFAERRITERATESKSRITPRRDGNCENVR